jgi:hypothetical protein
LACFSAVPRSHEPARLLELGLASQSFPAKLRPSAESLVPRLSSFGLQEHILLSYGDEEHGIDPWSIVDTARARSHLETAEMMVSLAEECVSSLTQ